MCLFVNMRVALTAHRKTRAELSTFVDAEYYGYFDEEDDIIVSMECEAEKAGWFLLCYGFTKLLCLLCRFILKSKHCLLTDKFKGIVLWKCVKLSYILGFLKVLKSMYAMPECTVV